MAVRVSVAIVTFNSSHCIENCVESVARCLPDAEVIVVDNGSDDDSVLAARRALGAVRALANARNIGFGRACNLAAMLATEEHVLFLNPDTRLVSVDVEAVAEAMREPSFGLRVGSLATAGRTPTQRPLLRRETSWLGEVLHHAVGTLRPRELKSRCAPESIREPRWAVAALILVRRREFLDLGGFDPRFFLYYEDRELSARYRDAGLPIDPLPGVVGTHRGGGSSGGHGIRAVPLAWEYLSWLEYVALRGGRSRAWLAWQVTRAPRFAACALTRALADRGLGGVRIAAKAQELEAVARYVALLAVDNDSPTFCPVARSMLVSARRQ